MKYNLMAQENQKIFKANRLSFAELKDDAFNYLKNVYHTLGKEFTMASPFAQLINVTLHLGRMILFYIENSITELNINTAFHSKSVVGLATLTGHQPSSGIAARGSVYITYNQEGDHAGETITIKNYTKIRNTATGLSYLTIFQGNKLQITVGAHDSKIEVPIIQGNLKYQQATGTGYAMQSFNFANKNNEIVDNFFINIYVNGERWRNVDSLLDMTYEDKACIVKRSLNGGIDVFFGTGNSGAVPPQGSSIVCEYLTCVGTAGNITENDNNNYWQFEDQGYDINGDYVDLNSIYNITSASEILFGADPENLNITRSLAPHVSRSFVLANAENYKYFLRKMNMFSIIDAFSGFNTYDDIKINEDLSTANATLLRLKEKYQAQVEHTGESSEEAKAISQEMIDLNKEINFLKKRKEEESLDDNTIYLYLIPDINKRLSTNENYFTCSVDRFSLSNDEKLGILNLIENSGQKILTVDNKILDPIFVRFSINIFIQMWKDYNFNSVKSSIISVVSNYLITNTRRDRIPVSDLIKIIEETNGVDSVSVFFDADKNNEKYYGPGNYGIDEYGDIILYRTIEDNFGNSIQMNDLIPLFRGGFTSSTGIEYEDNLEHINGPINVTLRGKTE